MDRVLYVVANGGKQLMYAQALNSHNLANANTVGFQQDLANFHTQLIAGPGLDTRAFATTEDAGVTFDKGTIQTTGRPLDVAVNGDGWLAVQAPDGSEAYTRAGNLHVNVNGQLMTGADHPVIGESGPIVVPQYDHLDIGTDGTVSIRPIGQEPSTLSNIGRIKLVSPDHTTLVKGGDGLLRTRDNTPVEAATGVTLVSGALESSNVNSIEAMVNMIALARQFEVQVKVMKTAEDNDASSTRIMNLG
ncbi:MAG: flagellar basal body rod protein FlgF [Thiogranum sp.]